MQSWTDVHDKLTEIAQSEDGPALATLDTARKAATHLGWVGCDPPVLMEAKNGSVSFVWPSSSYCIDSFGGSRWREGRITQ